MLNSNLEWSTWYNNKQGLMCRKRNDGMREIRISITTSKTIGTYNTNYLGKLADYSCSSLSSENVNNFIQFPITCRGANNIMFRVYSNGDLCLYNENNTDVTIARAFGFVHYFI